MLLRLLSSEVEPRPITTQAYIHKSLCRAHEFIYSVAEKTYDLFFIIISPGRFIHIDWSVFLVLPTVVSFGIEGTRELLSWKFRGAPSFVVVCVGVVIGTFLGPTRLTYDTPF